MITVTVRFNDFYEHILDLMITKGFAETREEAIRFALVKFAVDANLSGDETFSRELQKEFRKHSRRLRSKGLMAGA